MLSYLSHECGQSVEVKWRYWSWSLVRCRNCTKDVSGRESRTWTSSDADRSAKFDIVRNRYQLFHLSVFKLKCIIPLVKSTVK
jgi:hypothetical protein